MCHYRLPHALDSTETLNNDQGRTAVANLVKRFRSSGSSRSNLRAKVLGGADIGKGQSKRQLNIGAKNFAIALRILKEFSIPIVGKCVGGTAGRKIRFQSNNGELNFQSLKIESDAPAGQTSSSVLPHIFIHSHSGLARRKLSESFEGSDYTVIEGAESLGSANMVDVLESDVLIVDFSQPAEIMQFLEGRGSNDAIPTILVSVARRANPEEVVRALRAGAFEHLECEELALLPSVLKTALSATKRGASGHKLTSQRLVLDVSEGVLEQWLVVIGSSTGGVETLESVLRQLPAGMPPVLIVQHMPRLYVSSFARRLNEICSPHVQEAEDGMEVKVGNIYIAPGERQMKIVVRKEGGLVLRITEDPPYNGFAPSVDVMWSVTF